MKKGHIFSFKNLHFCTFCIQSSFWASFAGGAANNVGMIGISYSLPVPSAMIDGMHGAQ